MNPSQGEIVPMEADIQSHEQAQKLKKLFHQTKKTLYILQAVDETDESIKPVLITFTGYEPNHENSPFSIDDAKDVTPNLINLASIIENPEFYKNVKTPIIWLRRFMKAHGVDYVGDSYKEDLQFKNDEASYDSFQHHLWFLKLQGATQQQIKHSVKLYREYLADL